LLIYGHYWRGLKSSGEDNLLGFARNFNLASRAKSYPHPSASEVGGHGGSYFPDIYGDCLSLGVHGEDGAGYAACHMLEKVAGLLHLLLHYIDEGGIVERITDIVAGACLL
jgi:hypothetical protein